MLNERLVVFPLESVTVALKLDVPGLVGVPDITPVELFSDRPEGRDVTDHVYGGIPPVACSVPLNGLFTVTLLCVIPVIVSAFITVIDSACVSVALLKSLTWTVNDDVPAVVGVPLIAPPLFIVNPAGSEPGESCQIKGAVPPATASDCV